MSRRIGNRASVLTRSTLTKLIGISKGKFCFNWHHKLKNGSMRIRTLGNLDFGCFPFPLWLPSLYTRPATAHFANPNLLAVITSEVQETYMLPNYGCVGWHLPVKSLQGTPTCRICVAAICTFLLSTFNFCCSGAYHPAQIEKCSWHKSRSVDKTNGEV